MQQIEVLMTMLSKFAQRTSSNQQPTNHRCRSKAHALKHLPKMAIKDKEETGPLVKSSSAVIQKSVPLSMCQDDEFGSSNVTSQETLPSGSTNAEMDKKIGCSKSAALLN